MARVGEKFRLVSRYMQGLKVLYYGIASDDSTERKVTPAQMAYLVGRDRVENATAQIQYGELVFHGKGVDITTLPVRRVKEEKPKPVTKPTIPARPTVVTTPKPQETPAKPVEDSNKWSVQKRTELLRQVYAKLSDAIKRRKIVSIVRTGDGEDKVMIELHERPVDRGLSYIWIVSEYSVDDYVIIVDDDGAMLFMAHDSSGNDDRLRTVMKIKNDADDAVKSKTFMNMLSCAGLCTPVDVLNGREISETDYVEKSAVVAAEEFLDTAYRPTFSTMVASELSLPMEKVSMDNDTTFDARVEYALYSWLLDDCMYGLSQYSGNTLERTNLLFFCGTSDGEIWKENWNAYRLAPLVVTGVLDHVEKTTNLSHHFGRPANVIFAIANTQIGYTWRFPKSAYDSDELCSTPRKEGVDPVLFLLKPGWKLVIGKRIGTYTKNTDALPVLEKGIPIYSAKLEWDWDHSYDVSDELSKEVIRGMASDNPAKMAMKAMMNLFSKIHFHLSLGGEVYVNNGEVAFVIEDKSGNGEKRTYLIGQADGKLMIDREEIPDEQIKKKVEELAEEIWGGRKLRNWH